jgi:hypothetical protein
MDENYHCPKCRTDLRHSLALRGDSLARCPYCAHDFLKPLSKAQKQASTTSTDPNAPSEGDPPIQAATTSAITNAPIDAAPSTPSSSASSITNAPRAERPVAPITRKPHRRKRPDTFDEDYPPTRKRLAPKNVSWQHSTAFGVLAGMATGFALGILFCGVCTAATAGSQVDVEIVLLASAYVGTGLVFAGAVVGGLVGLFKGLLAEHSAEPASKDAPHNNPRV